MTSAPATLQAAFAAALRDVDPDAVPDGLSGTATRRFRIYRNNVRVALVGALAAAYPAVKRLVGERFFEHMALAFAAGAPARNRNLNLYGDGFADFIGRFAPAKDLSYLADVARLERAVLEACHAADAPALDPAIVAGLGAALASARLTPHPATRLVRSDFPVADIWRANTSAAADGPQAFQTGAAGALVLRPGFAVSVMAMDRSACAFAEALFAGADPETAYAAAVAIAPDFDVLSAFRDLLSAGAFSAIETEYSRGTGL